MNISIHSAYTGFFLVLSIFPALMLLVGVLAYTSFEPKDLLELISHLLPAPFMPMAERLLNSAYDSSSAPVLSISALAAIWSASRGVLGLKKGFNAIYQVEERRNYFVTRGIGMIYTALFVAVLMLTLVLHVFGTTILDYLHMTTVPVLLFLMDVIDLRFVLLLLLQTALFSTMYAALPSKRISPLQCIPGALFASLGWLIFPHLFAMYVEYFPNYANIFGSVYAVALAMLWLYCCINIVFYGAAINRLIEKWQERKD
jgi:membrane protein